MKCPKCNSGVKEGLNFCPKCGTAIKNGSSLGRKRDLVVGSGRSKRKIALAVSLIIMIASIAGFIYYFNSPKESLQSVAEAKILPKNDGKVEIPLAEINDRKAHFYKLDNVKYFAVKAADGSIRTAFDACEVCFQAKKGYYQEGDTMVCRNCGKRFLISELDKKQGGCKPIHLDSEIKDGKLTVKADNILKMKKYF